MNLPPRHLDPRLDALVKAFGVSKTFSLSQGAEVLGVDNATADRWLFTQQISDSRYRVALNCGRFWVLANNPFVSAAKVWAEIYADTLADLPCPFTATEFSEATRIPFASANTVLSALATYGHIRRMPSVNNEISNPEYRMPPRRTVERVRRRVVFA
jgi:hypothetical protein